MKHKYMIIAALAGLAANAAVPFAWTNAPGMAPRALPPVPHGSAVEFSVTLEGYTSPPVAAGADVRMWFQTNGMGSAWWSAPAVLDGNTITAAFGPAQDTGADRVSLFFGAPSNVFASAVLRLTHAPGFTPNEIELPVARLDFAAIDVANAPYYDKAETEAKIVELAPAPGNYAAVSNAAVHAAITNAFQDTAIASHSSQLTQLSQSLDTITYASPVMPARLCMDYPESSQDVEPESVLGYPFFRFADMPGAPRIAYQKGKFFIVCQFGEAIGQYDGLDRRVDFDMPDAPFGHYSFNVTMSPVATIDKIDRTSQTLAETIDFSTNNTELVETIEATETDPTVPAWAKAGTKPSYTASEVGAASASELSELADEVAPAVNGYSRLYSFITGSTNVNFVVTNYTLTVEEDAARTHFDPSDPDLDFSTVPSSLRLEDASSGTNRVVVDTRDWVVWYYAHKIGGAVAEAVSTAVDTCRAWCGFTATGLENPVPDTLILDVPNIWLMAGKTFEKHIAGSNAVWIIRSKDAVVPISDNSQSAGGFLELTDAFGTPYIRFNKTESYFVDPAADGVSFNAAAGEWQILYSTANCPKGGANAVLEGSTTYPGKAVLKAEDDPDCPATITWTGSANNWVMHAVPKQINGAVPPKMFFAAVVEVQGQDYIEYLRPMSIPHLLVDGVKIAPEIPASHPVGTTVSWKVVE